MKTGMIAAAFFLAASSLSLAQGTANIASGIFSLCGFLSGIMPVVSALMVVGAGASYAAGQFLGAETRARANVWATGMLMGALFGIIISLAGPAILGAMYGPTWDDSCQQAGGGGGQAHGEACESVQGGYCQPGEVCVSGTSCCLQANYCSNPRAPPGLPPFPNCCLPDHVCCTKVFGVEKTSCLTQADYDLFCED